MNTPAPYEFSGHNIRVVEIDGDPWFVGSEVLNILYGRAAGIGHVYKALDTSEIRKVKRVHLGFIGGKDVNIINERGLYKLAMRSDKPEARAFQDWVTGTVLALDCDFRLCGYPQWISRFPQIFSN